MINDIDDWGCPENLGLRREAHDPARIARKVGVVALLLGVAMWGLGSIDWPGELNFLEALDSVPGRLGAALCGGSGALALLVSRAALRNRP